MIPIALPTSDGAEFRNSMGVIVIGGLLSSTLLTLFVVPTVYTLFGDARRLTRRFKADGTREEVPRLTVQP
jgi:HAE1 family hydrophobic/amphiphilic exporter-1